MKATSKFPLFGNPFFKNIAILATGSIVAQMITVIGAPFITRLFSPEDIGIYTYILAVSHLFMSIINGRYDMSIVSEKEEKNVYPLIKLSLIFALMMSVVISIIYGIYSYFFVDYSSYLYTAVFLFILLLSYGIINVLTSFNNRNKEYKLISSVYVLRTSCQNLGAIILGLFKIGMLGLLIPYTIGQFLGISRQAKSLKPHFHDIQKVTREELMKVMRLHYKQPLLSAPAQFANSFSYSSITIFIGSLFNMAVVGYYSISVRLLGLPLSVISGNVSKVFYEEASREYDLTGGFYNAFRKTALFQFVLAIPIVLSMIFFAPPVFNFVFGEGWRTAGVYVTILAPMFGFRFIVTTLTPALLVAKKQSYELALQLLFIIASVVSFVITKEFSLSVETFLLLISSLYSIVYISFFVIMLRISRGKSEKT